MLGGVYGAGVFIVPTLVKEADGVVGVVQLAGGATAKEPHFVETHVGLVRGAPKGVHV